MMEEAVHHFGIYLRYGTSSGEKMFFRNEGGNAREPRPFSGAGFFVSKKTPYPVERLTRYRCSYLHLEEDDREDLQWIIKKHY